MATVHGLRLRDRCVSDMKRNYGVLWGVRSGSARSEIQCPGWLAGYARRQPVLFVGFRAVGKVIRFYDERNNVYDNGG